MKQHSPGFLKLVNEAKKRIKQLSIKEVALKLNHGDLFHFVDCREAEEWSRNRCKGAIHLGKGIIERDVEEMIPNHEAEIVLYCGGGYRSALAADALQKMGYSRVFSMDGGIRSWKQAGLPIDQAPRAH